jgi:hypothetical protein
MSSIWKDLLFLHGYLARKEDLLWHDQTAPQTAPESTAKAPETSRHDGPADAELKSGAPPRKRHSQPRPRVAMQR